jgi:maleate isomerase
MNVDTKDWSRDVAMHPLPRVLDEPYGRIVRMGLLALSTDLAIERDLNRLIPNDDVALFSTRIYLETPNSDRTFFALQDEIVAATKLLIPDSRLDVVVFGCTTASTIIGPARIAELVAQARPGVKCTNPATGVTEALRALKARRVSVVTPYTKQMTGNVVRFLDNAGFALTSVRSLGCDTDTAIGSIPAKTYIEAALAGDYKDADAIFISCTATRALDIIEQLEREIGLPVVTSNQAVFWHAMKLAGWNKAIPGYGRLMSSTWQ